MIRITDLQDSHCLEYKMVHLTNSTFHFTLLNPRKHWYFNSETYIVKLYQQTEMTNDVQIKQRWLQLSFTQIIMSGPTI